MAREEMRVPMDVTALEAELGEGAKLLAAAFLEDTSGLIERIVAVMGTGESKPALSELHALEGCCRAIKATEVETLCRKMQQLIKSQSWEDARGHLPELDEKFAGLCRFLRSYAA